MLWMLPTALAASEAELRAQVLAEHPELAGEVDDWEAVQALRSFAYTHTDTVVNVSSALYTSVSGWDAPTAYAWFDADLGGVVCGGTSLALVELYEMWGFEAWYLGFGDLSAGGFTHVETLVRIEHQGRELITLHDAQLDRAYTDLDGQPLDYLEVLVLLAEERHEELALSGPEAGYADTLLLPEDFGSMSVEDMASANWTTDPEDYSVETLESGVVKYRSPRTLERFEAVIEPWYGPFLEQQGLPVELAYLHLFPFIVTGGPDSEALLAQAQETLRTHGATTVGFEASEGFQVGDAGGTVNHRYEQAGYDLQTWYYGGVEVVAVEGGQALRVEHVDGHGGDYEAMFEFQERHYGELSVELEGSGLRAAVYDGEGALLEEQTGASGAFEFSHEEDAIAWLIVESEQGGILVDQLRFGPYRAPEQLPDTGSEDSDEPEHSEDTAGVTDCPSGGDSDSDSASEPGLDEEPTCGCSSGSSAAGLLLLTGLLLLRRREC